MNRLTGLLLITLLFVVGCNPEGEARSSSDLQADSVPTLSATLTATGTNTAVPEPTLEPTSEPTATPPSTEIPPTPTTPPTPESTATLTPEQIAPEFLPAANTRLPELYPEFMIQAGTGKQIDFENGISPESQLPKLKEYITETGETYALYTHPDHLTTVLYAINKETGERHLAYYTDGSHGVEALLIMDSELQPDVLLSDLIIPNANKVIGELIMNLLYINRGVADIADRYPYAAMGFDARVNWMNSLIAQYKPEFEGGGMTVNLRPLNLGDQLITADTRFVLRIVKSQSDHPFMWTILGRTDGAEPFEGIATDVNDAEISITLGANSRLLSNKRFQPGLLEAVLLKMFGGEAFATEEEGHSSSWGYNSNWTSQALVALNPDIHQIYTLITQSDDPAISTYANGGNYPRGYRGTIEDPRDSAPTTINLFVIN